MRIYFAAAASLGLIAFACGTDTQSSPNVSGIPTTQVCPKLLHPLALGAEALGAKGLADKTIALTFDTGPSEATAALEQYLAQQTIRATFFVNGENVPGLEAAMNQTSADGHLLANRTQHDEDISTLAADALVTSVTDTDSLLNGLTPAGKLYFRPPYGSWTAAAQTALQASPMSKYIGPVGWDIGDSLDATTGSDSECFTPGAGGTAKTAQQCGDLFLAQIRAQKKGIVLMHDGPPGGTGAQTSAMVQYMVPILKTEGYKFARMDELTLVPQSQLVPPEPGEDGGTEPVGDGGVVADPVDDPCINQR